MGVIRPSGQFIILLMKNCVERDISAQEICHILMGLKLVCAGGRNFVVVYTNASEWIPVSAGSDEQNVGCNNSGGKSFMQKYAERPDNMRSISMWDAAKFYKSRNWTKCKKPNIVRVFPRLCISDDEEKNEQYYRQKVLLFVPWIKECEIRKDGEKWRDVYDRCDIAAITTSEINIDVNGSSNNPEEYEDVGLESIVEMNEDWMIASRLSARGGVEEIELGRREVDVQYDWQTNSKKYESYGDLKYFQGFIDSEKKKDVNTVMSSDLPNFTFSHEQETVI